jgi:hypothetical protein
MLFTNAGPNLCQSCDLIYAFCVHAYIFKIKIIKYTDMCIGTHAHTKGVCMQTCTHVHQHMQVHGNEDGGFNVVQGALALTSLSVIAFNRYGYIAASFHTRRHVPRLYETCPEILCVTSQDMCYVSRQDVLHLQACGQDVSRLKTCGQDVTRPRTRCAICIFASTQTHICVCGMYVYNHVNLNKVDCTKCTLLCC